MGCPLSGAKRTRLATAVVNPAGHREYYTQQARPTWCWATSTPANLRLYRQQSDHVGLQHWRGRLGFPTWRFRRRSSDRIGHIHGYLERSTRAEWPVLAAARLTIRMTSLLGTTCHSIRS